MIAQLRRSPNALIFDNVSGSVDGNFLNACLTAREADARVLGVSDITQLNTQSLLMFNGNGMQVVGDMVRRVLVTRISPKIGNAWAGRYTFDPVDYVQQHRKAIIAAILTILRARVVYGQPLDAIGALPLGSFGDWRQVVQGAIVERGFVDPVGGIQENVDNDDTRESVVAFMDLWDTHFQGQQATLESINPFTNMHEQKITDFLSPDGSKPITGRRLRDWLAKHRDTDFGGRRFIKPKRPKLANGNNAPTVWQLETI